MKVVQEVKMLSGWCDRRPEVKGCRLGFMNDSCSGPCGS